VLKSGIVSHQSALRKITISGIKSLQGNEKIGVDTTNCVFCSFSFTFLIFVTLLISVFSITKGLILNFFCKNSFNLCAPSHTSFIFELQQLLHGIILL